MHYRDNIHKAAGDLAAVELYDLATDPDENTNIADHPESHETVAALHERLQRVVSTDQATPAISPKR